MISRLLDAVAGHVQGADAVSKHDDTLSLAISPDGDTRCTANRSELAVLRVTREGRVGSASGTTSRDGLPDLIGRAMTAAAAGEELTLHLPAPAPAPRVDTRAPRAAVAGVAELEGLARALADRLRRSDRRVEAWAERSVGTLQVGNSRGAIAGYEATLAGVGAVVESIGVGSAPPVRIHTAAAELPTLADVEALVSEVDRRLAPPIVPFPFRGGAALPVCLAPRAVVSFLRPLRAALLTPAGPEGRAPVPLWGGDPVFDPRLTLVDDPLVPGRPGSRPVDDEGVISRRLPLVERGRVVNGVTDLAGGARSNRPSTGHAWRTAHAPTRVGLTNLRMLPGPENLATLLTMMGRGILVEELVWSGGGSTRSGAFALRAPWTYLVEGGRVKGRLEGLVLSGNVFHALEKVGGVGNDATWVGAAQVASLLLSELMVGTEEPTARP